MPVNAERSGALGSDKIKVLIVDDVAVDAELSLMALRRGGMATECVFAADEPELRSALTSFSPDVILCDFGFPNFSGFAAQQIVRDVYPDTPLIFVSGTISEDRAVMALETGAVDYVLKSNLTRLPSAVERAVRDARDRKQLERSLAGSEDRARRQAARLESLWRIVNNPDLHGRALIQAMLGEAATAMRAEQHYLGVLRHVEDDQYVIDAVAGDLGPMGSPARRLLRVAARTAVVPSANDNGSPARRTESWDDVQTRPAVRERTREIGWHAAITTRFTAGAVKYDLTLGSLQIQTTAVPFGPEDHAYVEVLGSVFARQLELETMDASLRVAEFRSRHHAERLETLWRLVNGPATGEDFVHQILRAGARGIRRDQLFRGVLGRIGGGEIEVIDVAVDPADDDPGAGVLQVGRRTPLERTIIPQVARTQSWDDLTVLDIAPELLTSVGWQSAISTQFDTGGARYSLTFASSEGTRLPFGSEDSSYLDVLGSSLASQMQLRALEDSLRDEEERSRRHAQRLEALWQLVNNPNLRDVELWLAMLAQAAEAIQPGHDYRGTLWRVHGTDMVLEAIVYPAGHVAEEADSRIGRVMPLASTVIGRLLDEGGGTRSWDDVEESPFADNAKRQKHRTRSLAITTFVAGGSTWALSFASDLPASRPFGAQEHAYMEVLASFFANHVQQRWQFDRIQYQQSHDVLTGLLNRSQFRSQARAASRTNGSYAIVVVDVNGFREINETYGTMIGDAVLVEIGNALRQRTAGDEFVGRMGGDVFAIYVPNPRSRESVRDRVHDFASVFANGFSTGDRDGTESIARTASFGAAVAPEDGSNVDLIASHADAALLVAKERGHASTVFYAAGMEGDAQRRAVLRNELADAVAGDEFTLYYQPHVETSTGAVTGCEALIRWNHPTRGLLLPGHFIPFAEQAGIIGSIDTWVMRHALAAAKELSASWPDLRLYFNLSGRQAGDGKLIRAFAKAARNGLALSNVGVEITETDAMRDVEATRRVCRGLRRLGVRIAIDDFGTGYSSLSFLKRLPVDIVKIDRSFISGLLSDPHDEAITETIISIAQRFGFESLGEGAEQAEEVEWLRSRACRYVQGYAVCVPLPMDAFVTWLKERDQERFAAGWATTTA